MTKEERQAATERLALVAQKIAYHEARLKELRAERKRLEKVGK